MSSHPQCGYTQGTLHRLLGECDAQPPTQRFDRYFFQGVANIPDDLRDLFPGGVDNRARCINCGRTIAEHHDSLPPTSQIQQWPATQTPTLSTWWCQRSRISGAKKRQGVRGLLYNLAEQSQAFAEDPLTALQYVEDDLEIVLYFKSEEKAMNMQSAVLQLLRGPIAMARPLVEANDPTPTGDVSTVKKIRVLGTHYDPNATTSPQQTLDCLTSVSDATPSVVSLRDDLFIYQSIENPDHALLKLQKPERCHIVARANKGRTESANYLALWRLMHQLFDGIETAIPGVPEIKIIPSNLCKDVDVDLSTNPPRTRITLHIVTRTEEVVDGVMSLMKPGTERVDDTRLSTTVQILTVDVVTFKANLEKKALATQTSWDAHPSSLDRPIIE